HWRGLFDSETVNIPQNEVEVIINRWLVDYYYCCLLEVFKKDHYDDFCGFRGVVESVLVRPVQSTDATPTKVRVLQFLSRINEGEKLGKRNINTFTLHILLATVCNVVDFIKLHLVIIIVIINIQL
uniref:Uncharacterized protein n=1 Tax=Labrus bergylta TaxID=56723 RepID=A0A3Q3EHJ5_9LABR